MKQQYLTFKQVCLLNLSIFLVTRNVFFKLTLGELWKKTGGQNSADRPCSKYNWRHNNDVIATALTAGTQNSILYKKHRKTSNRSHRLLLEQVTSAPGLY